MSCGDNGCVFGHRGVGTNGGCRCVGAIKPYELRKQVQLSVQELRAENERLRAALDEAVKQIEHLAIETNARAAMVSDVSMQLGKLGRETWAALNAPAKER